MRLRLVGTAHPRWQEPATGCRASARRQRIENGDQCMISRADIERTYTRIGRHIRRTPVIDIALPGVTRPVALKLELFQHTASFKARGAFANLAGRKIPEIGIAAASGG